MARMTRTQISLEEPEYRFLKAQAALTGSSLSSVIRGLVREQMERAAAETPRAWELAGLVERSDFTGEEHDRILYGRPTDQEDALL